MTHIGIKIKERREQLGMSQDELAERMGYKNRSTIAKIEKGVNDVYQANIVKFAEVLHTSVAYLMSWDEEDPTIEMALEDGELLDAFHRLPEDKKRLVLELVHSFLN